MEFVPGFGGWVAFRENSQTNHDYVRLGLRGSRLVVQKVDLTDDDGIDTDRLRRVRIGAIEALANGPYRDFIVGAINEPTSDRPAENVWKALGKTADAARRALVEVGETPQEIDRLLLDAIAKGRRTALARVSIPKVRPYPRAFYEKIAEKYSYLAAIGSRRPAAEIADASDVPVSTVHRWVKEARRLELLPEGQRGKLA